MRQMFLNSIFIGVVVSLLGYELGRVLKAKFKLALFNPLLVAIAFVMIFLGVSGMKYQVYNEGAKYISYLLTPATVCLAIPLYEQIHLLMKNKSAVLFGILSGVFSSLLSIFVMCLLMGLGHEEYVTLLPKSITTAIGMGISEELGGMVTITVAVIIVTGILGNVIAEKVFQIFKIHNSIAKGIALGTASHAIGTAKAMELGEVEGAMSSLSIVISGILTVAAASIFANFM